MVELKMSSAPSIALVVVVDEHDWEKQEYSNKENVLKMAVCKKCGLLSYYNSENLFFALSKDNSNCEQRRMEKALK